MRTIRFMCFVLVIATLLTAWGCTDVMLDDTSSSVGGESLISVPDSSADVSDGEASSAPESSEESSSSAVIDNTPLYPESYDERAVYFGEHWVLNYDFTDAYFNNSVFVGNSIMLHYKNYVNNARATDSTFLGNSTFFAAASFSLYNNLKQTAESPDCALPSYQGKPMKITEAVGAMGVGTVYLSLMALNDIAIYANGETGVEETYKLATKLIEELNTAYPRVKVVVLSNTYLHYSSDYSSHKLNNGSISTLNIKVLDYCNANGIDFIDVSTVLLDGNDCLGDAFCSDVGSAAACHLTKYAYNAWTVILRDYAARKQAGTWQNPDSMKGLMPSR